MPESDDHNSSWNRREPQPLEAEEAWPNDLDDSETEIPDESEWDASKFDLGFKFEDYAPIWVQNVKAFYNKDPEWSLTSTIGAIAIILTVSLLLAMPDNKPMDVVAELAEPVILGSLPDSKPIDSRIEIAPSDSYLLVDFETEPLYVSFGKLQNSFSGMIVQEEKRIRLDLPDFKTPEFNPSAEPRPALVLDVQKIRVIEREMLDPNIDLQFLVETKSNSIEMQSQLNPSDRFLFDQNWKLIDLARADQQRPQIIRPTLYHERFPHGKHLQVGQEEHFDRSQLDHLTRVTTAQQESRINLEIRKQFPESGTVNQLLTYSIIVKNGGTSPAYDVLIDETLSPLVSLVDFSPRGEVKENHLHWKIARLDPEEERELSVKVYLNQTGNVKTHSNIKLASNVAASTEIYALNLNVQIKGPETVIEGNTFPIDIVITNQGKQDQAGINLNLDLPEGLEHEQGRRLTLKIDQLNANQSRTLRARVKSIKPGVVISQVILMAGGHSLGEAALEQTIQKRKYDAAPSPVPSKQKVPDAKFTPLQSVPTQLCPCQPVALPVFYLIP
ncbi:MAG: hypothetical protein QM501_08070 [Gimesia sp.]